MGIKSFSNTFFNLKAYPNPSSNKWIIKGSTTKENISATLYNTLGEAQMKLNIEIENNIFNLCITNKELANGIYFLTISDGEHSQTIKLINN